MRLIFEREDLEKILDPSKRTPTEEAARKATLKAARELKLTIKPTPAHAAPAHD